MTDETRRSPAETVSPEALIEPFETPPDAALYREFQEWLTREIAAAFIGRPLTAYQRPESK